MTAISSSVGSPTGARRVLDMAHPSSFPPKKTMADCLDDEDPVASLNLLATMASEQARIHALELHKDLQELAIVLPELLLTTPRVKTGSKLSIQVQSELENDSNATSSSSSNSNSTTTHPYQIVAACAESVSTTLTKISSGGSEASHEIRQLEGEKRFIDAQAASVATAWSWRQQAMHAEQSLAASAWLDAAQALQPWLAYNATTINNNENHKPSTIPSPHEPMEDSDEARVRAYAGGETLTRLQNTYEALTKTLTAQYETAVAKSDLQLLGQLTPILTVLELEHEGLRLYKVYLDTILGKTMSEALVTPPTKPDPNKKQQQPQPQSPPPHAALGRVYNAAVSVLRHHLPMVSHCLYKADGAVAVVQLVYTHTERTVLPVLSQYQRDKQLARVARTASHIYAALEEQCTGQSRVLDDDDDDEHGSGNIGTRQGGGNNNNGNDDCGFSVEIGSLADVDIAMEEAAVCIQHSESYFRFVQHTCREVNRARQLRHEQDTERARMERERHEWSTGEKSQSSMDDNETDGHQNAIDAKEFRDLEILPVSTNLVKAVAELGGHYASIERCLLLASMQRAFVQTSDDDPRSYRPMSILPSSVGSGSVNASTGQLGGNVPAGGVSAWQTTIVETCWYAARRGTQRAMATGHAGTASVVTNFTVECLNDVCLEVLVRRAEDLGVHPLKPGEGLLVGSANLFNNASNLINLRQTATVGGGTQAGAKQKDELLRKQKREKEIARACAVMNDLEVAANHTQQLESLLNSTIDRGFAPDSHDKEQLLLCVKSLGAVAESFRTAAITTIESLESVLKQRIRSIVGDAVGSDSTTFMGASSVMGVGGKTGDRDMIRMNYDLNDESYNLMQISEGYVTRLCSLLDELLQPLRRHLAPRLWDNLILTVMGTSCKRLETSLRKCQYTSLGGFALDSDIRDLLHYTKEQLHAPEYNGSNMAILRACPALSKLVQIAKLQSVDDLEDVLDLISSAKRKGQWDLKLDDVKAFLGARVEFDSNKIDELLRLPED